MLWLIVDYATNVNIHVGLAKFEQPSMCLIHWDRVTHIYVSKLTIIASDNGLQLGWHQAIIRVSNGMLLIGYLGTNVSNISIETQDIFVQKYVIKNVVSEMAAILSRPQYVTSFE